MKKSLFRVFHNWYRKAIKHPQYRWLVVLGTLFYLLSPLDISPDVFPIIGWLDDGAVVALLVTEMSQLMVEQLKSRSRQQTASFSQTDTFESVDPTADVIDVEAVRVA
ncbi:MAG: DUF1232 domain-containing protein [Leptolyngbya sp. SIO4C1]|nr:DUF1232 domain-containing protein [Leptolyngbya sp. SIO4C1]